MNEQHLKYLGKLDELDWGRMAKSATTNSKWLRVYGIPVDPLAILMDIAGRLKNQALVARLIAAAVGQLMANRDMVQIWMKASMLDTDSDTPFMQGYAAGQQAAAQELAELLNMEVKSGKKKD